LQGGQQCWALQATPNKQRLVATNLDTLELRRLRTDLVVCYKIVFGLIKADVNKFFSFAPVSNTRGHRYKLFVEQSTRNVRHYFFLSTSCQYME